VNPTAIAPAAIAACAECIETTQHAQLGAQPQQSLLQRFRAADGKLRIDFGAISIISDPATGERILLDHLAQQARILMDEVHLPSESLNIPGLPNVPGPPNVPGLSTATSAVSLGKNFIEGMEVEGMRYVFQALDSPITSWEVWTSTKLLMPVLTRAIGSFGVRTCICKCTPVAPPASLFQVPSGYTVIRPPLPQ
jgi:hypothetical protein